MSEFFDYRCPYCWTMQPTLDALLAKDHRVRLVAKEWPIFGGASVIAARIALASQWQGKYAAVHKALFELPRAVDHEARAVGFQGTPGFVVSTFVAPGAIPASSLDELVTRAVAR